MKIYVKVLSSIYSKIKYVISVTLTLRFNTLNFFERGSQYTAKHRAVYEARSDDLSAKE